MVRFAALTFLLLGVAIAAAGLLMLANGILGDRSGLGGVQLAGWLLLALAPVSLALANSRELAQDGPQELAVYMFTASSGGPAAAVLMAPWLALGPATVFAASGLSICASLLLMIARCDDQGPCLPARKQT